MQVLYVTYYTDTTFLIKNCFKKRLVVSYSHTTILEGQQRYQKYCQTSGRLHQPPMKQRMHTAREPSYLQTAISLTTRLGRKSDLLSATKVCFKQTHRPEPTGPNHSRAHATLTEVSYSFTSVARAALGAQLPLHVPWPLTDPPCKLTTQTPRGQDAPHQRRELHIGYIHCL